MKKLKGIITVILLVLCALISGVYLGVNFEEKTEESISEYIAVINMDEGVAYHDGTRNFGNELINTLDYRYQVTGISDARIGIEDGRYAAYIIIPTGFSESVISINSEPSLVSFEYEFAKNLSSHSKQNALINISDFESDVNDRIRTMYLDSILSYLHEGQDIATQVILNDAQEQSLITAIQAYDLVDIVEITQPTRIDSYVDEFTIEMQINENIAIINDIDSSYKGFLEETDSELNTIKNDFNALNQMISDLNVDVDSFPHLLNTENKLTVDLTELLSYLQTVHQENNTIVDTLNSAVTTAQEELSTAYTQLEIYQIEKDIQGAILNYLINNPTESYQDAINYFEITQELDDFVMSLNIEDCETILDYSDHYLNSGSVISIDNMEQAVNEVLAISSISLQPTSADEINSKVTTDFSSLHNNQLSFLNEVNTNYETEKMTSSTLNENINNYSPLEKIDGVSISSFIEQVLQNANTIETSVVNNNEKYLDYIEQVYEHSFSHINEMREDMIVANELSNSAVEEGLATIKEIKIKNSNENQTSLQAFIEMLPYTRRGSLENTNVIKFVSNPISFVGDNNIVMEVKTSTSHNNLLFVVIGLLFATVISGFFYFKSKN